MLCKSVFRLTGAFEFSADFMGTECTYRVEIFRSEDNSNAYRAKILKQYTCDLIPTFLNIDLRRQGRELIYGSEIILTDCSMSFYDTPEMMNCIIADSTEDVLLLVMKMIIGNSGGR
jgi:hypothetical protein